jgi:type IV secretion system protein VirB10
MNLKRFAGVAVSSIFVTVPLLLLAKPFGPQAGPDQAKPEQTRQSSSEPNGPGAANPSANNAPAQLLVPAGTHLPLVLHNSISTRNAQSGDPVYLETVFPVIVNGRIAIPAGSYVQGAITEAKRPGKGKGGAAVRIRLTTLILPNGYTVSFDAVPTNAGTGGGEYADKEGQISKDRDKAADAGTVIKSTAAGAGIGAIAGRGGEGAGIGAGIGATAGLAAVLMMRGPELELPRGSNVDITLDRPLYLDPTKINFTEPGRASPVPAPVHEPAKSPIPF